VTYQGASQTSIDAAGLVGAGSRLTAVGGFAFNAFEEPAQGMTVRLFNSLWQVTTCDNPAGVVAQDVVDSTGFYFVWRRGLLSDTAGTSDLLPANVRYAVQLCNGASQRGLKLVDNKLREKEFEQLDFSDILP
jgi:hypothetical protein